VMRSGGGVMRSGGDLSGVHETLGNCISLLRKTDTQRTADRRRRRGSVGRWVGGSVGRAARSRQQWQTHDTTPTGSRGDSRRHTIHTLSWHTHTHTLMRIYANIYTTDTHTHIHLCGKAREQAAAVAVDDLQV
jgi:hypothetical protein